MPDDRLLKQVEFRITAGHTEKISFHFISIYLSIEQELEHITCEYKWWTTRPL